MRLSTHRWFTWPTLAAALLLGPAVLSTRAQPPAAPGGQRGNEVAPDLPPARPGAATVSRSGDVMRLSRNVPGDAKPILIDADELITWTEQGRVVLLLKGKVLVQQNVVQARFQQGVAWVDVEGHKKTGVMHLDLYSEGQVRLDVSADVQEGGRAVLDLNTRGDFRLRVRPQKVKRENAANDPLVARARALGLGPASLRPQSPPPQEKPQTPAPAKPAAAVTPPPPKLSAVPKDTSPPAGGVVAADHIVPAGQEGKSAAVVKTTSHEELLARADPPQGAGSGSSTGPVSGTGTGAGQGPPPAFGPADSWPRTGARPATPEEARRVPGGAYPDPGSPPAPGPRSPNDPPSGTPGRPTADPGNPVAPREARPGQPGTPPGAKPPPAKPAAKAGPARQYSVMPRNGSRFDIKIDRSGKESIIIITGGVILTVRNAPGIGFVDMEADRVVIWTSSLDPNQVKDNIQTAEGETSNELEFYLAGHVEIREQQRSTSKEEITIRAEEVYYDVNRNVAVALTARMEFTSAALTKTIGPKADPVILTADELLRTGPTTYETVRSEIFSSKLPSDPGLKIYIRRATVQEKEKPMKNIFGGQVYDRKTGDPVIMHESIIYSHDVTGVLSYDYVDIPYFYTPYMVADARDPLGPLQNLNLGFNQIYGVQAGITLDVDKLLGFVPYQGTRWLLQVDDLSYRGPGLGTTFDYGGKFFEDEAPSFVDGRPILSDPARYEGFIRLYGMYDRNFDNLGGARPNLDAFLPEGFRGRAFWRQNLQDLPGGFQVQSQVSYLSDRNYLEQYYYREFSTDPNQSTHVLVKQQQDNWAWTALLEPRIRDWVTTTEWLPRLDGYLLGESFLDRFTYNAWADAAFAQLRRSNDQPSNYIVNPYFTGGLLPQPPDYPIGVSNTDVPASVGRLSLMQELAMPFTLGAFRVVPYAKLELAEYTQDLNGTSLGRVWGGGGLRSSLPLTRLYPDVQSDYFNLQGINHKIVFSSNYFYAQTNEPYSKLPQLDRLNDDITDQTIRDFRPYETTFNQSHGYFLATSKLFDPQLYAIRQLIDNRLETLDHIDVLQLDINQRWQTKRGFPGAEHIIDYMSLDTSMSYFPESARDNFGKPFAFLQYRYLWNIGDRTSFESTGYMDPITLPTYTSNPSATGALVPTTDMGPRIFTVSLNFNRDDRTSFSLSYRMLEPLQSRAVTGSVTYVFSPKYAMSLSSSYDFGTSVSQSNSLLFTRIGSDVQISAGLTYNAIQSNFGVLFEIVPNLVPANRRLGAMSGQQLTNR